MTGDHTSTQESASGNGRPAVEAYTSLLAHLGETSTLSSTLALLHWDQETMMPPRAASLRSEQIALLTALVHRRQTDPRIGEWLEACEANTDLAADSAEAANLREIRRKYDRSTRLPESLVREMAQSFSLAMEAWKEAREASDYAAFAPWLEKVVQLNRAKAECLRTDPGQTLYDALLEEYEPGADAAHIEEVFGALRQRLVPLIQGIAEAERRPDPAPQRLRVPVPLQQAFSRRIAEALGYRLDAGRLDTSTHPFCMDIGPGDSRITTRFTEDRFADALSSTMHEVGHVLYEQGLPKQEHWGQPLAEAASFAIHESQSRLWENMVGRSRPFWEWALPVARETFGEHARELSVDAVYGAVNLVEPSLIRVDADEATYNLHIMLRFDLERALLTGELPVSELPSAWNERVRGDLGIEVPDDRRGCLQDVHWSMGAIGYFPTYTLGTLYAAQFWHAVQREIPDLDEQFRRGEFGPLLGWLRDGIHVHGMRYRAAELCERVTGQALSHEPLVAYLESKLAPLYGL
jgi:carboxypeptidase Taq